MKTPKRAPVTVQGWDLALNHSAMVELTDGKLTGFAYITDKAASAGRSQQGTHIPVDRMKREFDNDRDRLHAWRLAFQFHEGIKLWLTRAPDYVGIENYALKAEQGAHQMGEIGGVARFACLSAAIPFRLHDPVSVKMFVTHDGTCSKDQVERSVIDRWAMDFSRYNSAASKDRTTSEDLADAFGIAMMVWTEVQLRRGFVRLDSLHEKELRVFNRITKAQPVALLNREWISQLE